LDKKDIKIDVVKACKLTIVLLNLDDAANIIIIKKRKKVSISLLDSNLDEDKTLSKLTRM